MVFRVCMNENTTIKLKKETMNSLRRYGAMGDSWDTVLQRVMNIAEDNIAELEDIQKGQSKKGSQRFDVEMFKLAVVDSHGKATISRTLAGKTIEYRVKQ